MRDGFFRREDRIWEKVGTLGIWLLAPHSKKKFTVPELLGRHALKTLPTAPPEDADAQPDEALIEAERAAVLARALAWAQE